MTLDHPNGHTDPGAEPVPDASGAPAGQPGQPDWVLQADAATIAGCSVSAIRKWRREGVVNDRLTTTIGGLERVEVRLHDVIERCGHRQGQPPATSSTPSTPSTPASPASPPTPEVAAAGTVFLPLADLQAMILNLGEAERRALEATNRVSSTDAEIGRLTDALAVAEAAMISARSDADALRRRVREMEARINSARPASGPGSDGERLRDHVARLETRMAEARSEVEGQRRRIRELETRLAAPAATNGVAEAEVVRQRELVKRLEAKLAAARTEFDNQRRRIRELEEHLATPSGRTLAAESENERLREHLGQLEARLAEASGEVDSQRRGLDELEVHLAASAERALAAAAESDRLREQMGRLEARIAAGRDQRESQRRRIQELETALLEQQAAADAAAAAEPSFTPPEPEIPAGLTPVAETPVPLALLAAADDPRTSPQPAPSLRPPEPPVSTEAATPDPATPEPPAEQLRRLYHRLHTRRRDQGTGPAENQRWVADLAAYDCALVVACAEHGVPTAYHPGDRLPAEERVRLTRDLSAAGLDVRQQVAS